VLWSHRHVASCRITDLVEFAFRGEVNASMHASLSRRPCSFRDAGYALFSRYNRFRFDEHSEAFIEGERSNV